MADTVGSIPLGAAPKVVSDPTFALQQAQLQRRMMLAQMLQQSAKEAGGAYSSLNGMRVVPRMGIAPALSQIADTLLGGYEQKKAIGDQASLSQQQYANIASMMGGGQGGAAGASAGGAGDGSSGSGSTPQSGGTSAMNPWGLDPGVAARLYYQDPQEYSKQLLQYHQPTDQIKNNQWMGLDQGTALAQEKAEANVKGTGSYSPNSTIVMPNGQMSVAPDFTNGRYGAFTADGQPVMGQIQGSGVIAQQAGDTTRAQEMNKVLPNVPLSNGATVPMLASQAVGGQPAQGFGAQIQAESGGNQNAVSSAGARGVAQLMPATARQYEQKLGLPPGSTDTDPNANAKAGAAYMSDLTNHYMKISGGDQAAASALARMAYNAGPGKVDSWMQSGMNPSALPQETQNYNGRVNAAAGSQPTAGGLPAPVPMAPAATGIGQSTQDKALSEKRAGNIADMEQDINDKATSAQAKLVNNQKIMDLLPSVSTGPLSEQIAKTTNVLHQLGWTGADPTNFQELQKVLQQTALESAKQVYGNRITNADMATLPMWTPGATMTDNALRVIVGADTINQQRQLQKQNVYNEYKKQNGDLNQFPGYFNTNYPQQGLAATSSLTPGASPVVAKPATQTAAPKIRRYNPATHQLEDI